MEGEACVNKKERIRKLPFFNRVRVHFVSIHYLPFLYIHTQREISQSQTPPTLPLPSRPPHGNGPSCPSVVPPFPPSKRRFLCPFPHVAATNPRPRGLILRFVVLRTGSQMTRTLPKEKQVLLVMKRRRRRALGGPGRGQNSLQTSHPPARWLLYPSILALLCVPRPRLLRVGKPLKLGSATDEARAQTRAHRLPVRPSHGRGPAMYTTAVPCDGTGMKTCRRPDGPWADNLR